MCSMCVLWPCVVSHAAKAFFGSSRVKFTATGSGHVNARDFIGPLSRWVRDSKMLGLSPNHVLDSQNFSTRAKPGRDQELG